MADHQTPPGSQGVRPFGERERFVKEALLCADGAEGAHSQAEVSIDLENLAQFRSGVIKSAQVA